MVSRPTFAEIAAALSKAGRQDLFAESGDIVVGDVTFHTDQDVPQAVRAATGMAERAPHCDPRKGDPVYADDQVEIFTKRSGADVQVIERRPGIDPRVVTVPKAAVTPLSGELIMCLVK